MKGGGGGGSGSESESVFGEGEKKRRNGAGNRYGAGPPERKCDDDVFLPPLLPLET